MARVVALFDDLLLGSNVLGWMQAAGHEATLSATLPDDLGGVDVLVVDLNLGVATPSDGPKRLGIYSHVDPETKRRAEAEGFDLVVPRSRLAREGGALVDRLVER